MTIRHSHVFFKEPGGETLFTTFDPHFRVTSPDIKEGDVELMVWDLAGLTVTYEAAGTSELIPVQGGDVYHIGALEGMKGRPAQLDADVLHPDFRRSNAVIELKGAKGETAKPTNPVTMELASEVSIRQGKPERFDHPPGTRVKDDPTDLVTFTVTVKDHPDDETPCLTLTCTSESGEIVGTIALLPGAVIGISNSCPQIEEPAEHDLEFSRYYDLLTTRRPNDVLIPILSKKQDRNAPVKPRLMEGMRCYIVSTMSYNEDEVVPS